MCADESCLKRGRAPAGVQHDTHEGNCTSSKMSIFQLISDYSACICDIFIYSMLMVAIDTVLRPLVYFHVFLSTAAAAAAATTTSIQFPLPCMPRYFINAMRLCVSPLFT